jgi:hypothetical protein
LQDSQFQLSQKSERSNRDGGDEFKKMLDQKISENFSLKEIIDNQRKEIANFKKKLQAQDDLLVNKQIEISSLNEEIKGQYQWQQKLKRQE